MKIFGIICIALFIFSGMTPAAFAGDKTDALLDDFQNTITELASLKAKEGAGSENYQNLKMGMMPLLQELGDAEATMSPKQKQRYDLLNKKLGDY
jgi:hypothetical protein